MKKNTTPPGTLLMGAQDVLSDYLHQGACKMLTTAVEAEVQAYLDRFEDCATTRRVIVWWCVTARQGRW